MDHISPVWNCTLVGRQFTGPFFVFADVAATDWTDEVGTVVDFAAALALGLTLAGAGAVAVLVMGAGAAAGAAAGAGVTVSDV